MKHHPDAPRPQLILSDETYKSFSEYYTSHDHSDLSKLFERSRLDDGDGKRAELTPPGAAGFLHSLTAQSLQDAAKGTSLKASSPDQAASEAMLVFQERMRLVFQERIDMAYEAAQVLDAFLEQVAKDLGEPIQERQTPQVTVDAAQATSDGRGHVPKRLEGCNDDLREVRELQAAIRRDLKRGFEAAGLAPLPEGPELAV